MPGNRVGYDRGNGSGIGDVERARLGVPAVRDQSRGGRVDPGRINVGQHHARTTRTERRGERLADTRGRPGDDGDFALKMHDPVPLLSAPAVEDYDDTSRCAWNAAPENAIAASIDSCAQQGIARMTITTDLLPCVEVEPAGTANAAVIWLHGLGADGHDFVPIVPELGLDPEVRVRFVFPHAPSIPVTINQGYVMPAWYDILEMNLERKVDLAQLRASADAVGRLVERERSRGIASQRIVIAGFSQGGAVAFELALSYPAPLAGLIALSTYFATQNTVEANPVNRDLAILICHGKHDTMVPERMGQSSYRRLAEMGYAVDYRTYPVAHGVDPDEIRDIGAWLNARLG